MPACLLVRLRPDGPWRIGPAAGVRDRVDTVFHSDTLFSAVCGAMREFDLLEEWLSVTARHARGGQVRLSSMFPWQGDHLYVPAPRHLWPPPSITRLRARGARFIPASVVASLARGKGFDEEKWEVDGLSECLIRAGRRGLNAGPFRVALRSNVAVDRLQPGVTAVHQTTCLEFSANAGLWCVAEFSSENAERTWSPRLQAVFRLLADSGLGGERSKGWGHSVIEQFRAASLPSVLLGDAPSAPEEVEPEAEAPAKPPEPAWWLLSLYSPAEQDAVDWDRGSYSLVSRAGRVESAHGWGMPKKAMRMVAEGSVLLAASRPEGTAHDVAPEGFPHPVYRTGQAVALELPWRVSV